jgi:hypothetical protein
MIGQPYPTSVTAVKHDAKTACSGKEALAGFSSAFKAPRRRADKDRHADQVSFAPMMAVREISPFLQSNRSPPRRRAITSLEDMISRAYT